MKRGKKLLLLVIALAAIIAAALTAVAVSQKSEEKKEAAEAQKEADATVTVFTLDVPSITHVSWIYPDASYSFTKSGDSWTDDDDDLFPVSTPSMETLLGNLTNVTSQKCITSPADLSQFGLTEPQMTISINDGSERSLLIGDETGIGGQYYLSNGDGNVYVIDSSLAGAFSVSLSDVIQLEEIRPMTDLQSFTIAKSDGSVLEVGHSEDTWSAGNGGSMTSSDTTLTHDFYKYLRNLEWSSIVTWDADEAYLEEAGLSTPACTVTANCTDDSTGETFSQVFEIGNVFPDDDSYYYCRLAGSRMVYLIEAKTTEAFLNTQVSDLMGN